jgi:hypothetical protein
VVGEKALMEWLHGLLSYGGFILWLCFCGNVAGGDRASIGLENADIY